MASELTKMRIKNFFDGVLELVVTPSERVSFQRFLDASRGFIPPFTVEPSDRTEIFKIEKRAFTTSLTAREPFSVEPTDINRIPFALISEEWPFTRANPDSPKTKLDDEWGMEKIELRNKIRGIESNFSILMSAMELLKMQIDSLVKATDAKDAP